MSSDMEAAFAFLARREAKRSMTASRWAHLLSLDMGWMNPGQARSFVERAARSGLLGVEEDRLRLVVDPAGVEVPRGFRPKHDADAPAGGQSTEAPDLFLGWVAKLCVHSQVPREQVLQRVAAAQERMAGLLNAEAAVLWLAKEAGLDVAKDAAAAEAALRVKRTMQA